MFNETWPRKRKVGTYRFTITPISPEELEAILSRRYLAAFLIDRAVRGDACARPGRSFQRDIQC